MARPKSQLSHFIESLPTDLPAKEVVKRAAAAGMVTSDANVHRVRDRARKAARGGTLKSGASKKVAPKAAPVAPKAAPKKAAVKKAAVKKAAIQKPAPKAATAAPKAATAAPKAATAAPKAATAAPKAATAAPKAAPAPATGAEAVLRRAVLELGLDRAEGLIANMRAQVSKLIAGF